MRAQTSWLMNHTTTVTEEFQSMPEECKTELKITKPSTHNLLVSECSRRIENCMTCEDYCSMLRLCRITAYVLKAVQAFKALKKRPTTEGHQVDLTAEELSNAEILWIAESQLSLIKDRNFEQWKSQLGLFLDEAGLWRCDEC